MDKTCIWLEKLVTWVNKCGAPPVQFVGKAGRVFRNPPAKQIEIGFVTQGNCSDLLVGDQKASLRTGDFGLHSVHFGNNSSAHEEFMGWCLFLNMGDEHDFAELNEAPLICYMQASSHAEIENAFANLAARCCRYGKRDYQGYFDASPMFQPAQTPTDIPSLLVKNALLDLLAVMLRDARGTDESADSAQPPAIQRAIEYMTIHAGAPGLTLKDVAGTAKLSVEHFGRLFRQRQGVTPMRWLQELRIRQGRFLLTNTSMRVDEIAYEVGFQDPFHFSRVFKRIVGLSPRNYRLRKR